MKSLVPFLLLCVLGASGAQAQGLTTFKPAAPLDLQQPGGACEFKDLKLPEDFVVIAAAGYRGRATDMQIDQSGHVATQVDVAVNHPKKPVALMLGAYEPTVWNIGWTRQTRIVAVLVSGYHRQVIAGLDPSVPTLVSTYDNKADCGHFHSVQNNTQLNPLARRLFGRAVDTAFAIPAAGGIVLGEAVAKPEDLVTSTAVTPQSFRDPKAPLAVPAGLQDAVDKGILRRASAADMDAWSAAGGGPDQPPVVGSPRAPRRSPMGLRNAYVVLKPFQFPAGLSGANAGVFYVLKGVPPPTGNPGHSTVNDFNTNLCTGLRCTY